MYISKGIVLLNEDNIDWARKLFKQFLKINCGGNFVIAIYILLLMFSIFCFCFYFWLSATFLNSAKDGTLWIIPIQDSSSGHMPTPCQFATSWTKAGVSASLSSLITASISFHFWLCNSLLSASFALYLSIDSHLQISLINCFTLIFVSLHFALKINFFVISTRKSAHLFLLFAPISLKIISDFVGL